MLCRLTTEYASFELAISRVSARFLFITVIEYDVPEDLWTDFVQVGLSLQ